MRLAVPNLDQDTLAAARRHCEEFGLETDSARWGEINRSFHYTLYAASRRPYYLQIVRTSLDRIDRYLRAQLTLTNGVMRADREHQAILEACLNGDAARASRLTRDHVLDAGRSLVVFLKNQRS